ncbi:ATP-binding cassette domain-containing protein [Bacillus sp. SL00103]
MKKARASDCWGKVAQGKSTLGRIILGLEEPKAGQVLFEGQDIYIVQINEHANIIARHVQAVFQDSYSAVNPRWTVEQILSEPLENYETMSRKERKSVLIHWLEESGSVKRTCLNIRINSAEASCKGINIARALLLQPKLVVLDESVSA